MSARDKNETTEETRSFPAPKPSVVPPTPEDMILDCTKRATKITYRKRAGKKGTSITISFSK